MQKLLNIFPLPNYAGGKTASGTACNFQISDTLDKPGYNELLRVDYNISQNVRAFFRGSDARTHNQGPASTVNPMSGTSMVTMIIATTSPKPRECRRSGGAL